MRSAFEIVPHLLRQSEKSAESLITPLKLQKLLYYAQAWLLVFRGAGLLARVVTSERLSQLQLLGAGLVVLGTLVVAYER